MKKFKVPVITGLIFIGLDLVGFWLYWAYTCVRNMPVCGEGMLGAAGFHYPVFLVLDAVARFLPTPVAPSLYDTLYNATFWILIFLGGLVQFFVMGFALGWLGRAVYRFGKKHIQLV